MKEFHDRRVPSALTSLSRMGSQPPPPRSIEPAVFGLGMRTIWVCVIFLRIFGIFKFQGLFRDFSAFQTNVFDDSRLRLIPPFLFGCKVVWVHCSNPFPVRHFVLCGSRLNEECRSHYYEKKSRW